MRISLKGHKDLEGIICLLTDLWTTAWSLIKRNSNISFFALDAKTQPQRFVINISSQCCTANLRVCGIRTVWVHELGDNTAQNPNVSHILAYAVVFLVATTSSISTEALWLWLCSVLQLI
jgi:hypothetical protein